jgi:hypothetical protein
MADQDIVNAARALKAAHLRADALGGEHQADVAAAYAALLDAVGDVDEPAEVTARRAEVEALSVPTTGTTTNVEVNASQDQSASGG